jgi:hypothetical protein
MTEIAKESILSAHIWNWNAIEKKTADGDSIPIGGHEIQDKESYVALKMGIELNWA